MNGDVWTLGAVAGRRFEAGPDVEPGLGVCVLWSQLAQAWLMKSEERGLAKWIVGRLDHALFRIVKMLF